MATTSGIRAGRAFVELFADDSKLVRGLRRAERKLRAFGDSVRNLGLKMAALGSAMLAPLAASAKLFSGYGDQVAKMAKRTGLSVETLSELRFVASQTGTAFETLVVRPTVIGTDRLVRAACRYVLSLRSATFSLRTKHLSSK